MPRTSPSFTGDPNSIQIILRFIDASGDIRSVTFTTFDTTTPAAADLETLVAAFAAATNANIFESQIKLRYSAVPDASVANFGSYQSVYDNIAINYKDGVASRQQTVFIPAPLETLVPGDTVANTQLVYTNARNAALTVLGGDFAAVTARFTERREKNDAGPA